ncbi:MAG: SGNH/GDSL hydrolase family protein [Endozoicomonadaceae bacterium]|nr:SGNH/GDSL hydrolase family protein [Endozoicomonadaceae bacterium]
MSNHSIKLPNYFNIFIINILILIIILLICEVVSQAILPVDLPDPLIVKKKQQWKNTRKYDPDLFWTLKPYAVMRGVMDTNSQGLRGPEIAPKTNDKFRILSLGESSTYGTKVKFEETYSKILEKTLGAMQGKPVEVINAGVPGYSMFQGLTFLHLHGLDLNPDMVLIYFGFNDFLKVGFRAKQDMAINAQNAGFTDRELYNQRQTLRYRIFYFFQKNSNLVRLLLQYAAPSNETVVLSSKRIRVPDTDRRWILSEFRKLSEQHGFRLVVVIPWYKTFEKHANLLRELKSWDKIKVIDLPRDLAYLSDSRSSYFLDIVHPTAKGHRLIGQEIRKQLLDTGHD